MLSWGGRPGSLSKRWKISVPFFWFWWMCKYKRPHSIWLSSQATKRRQGCWWPNHFNSIETKKGVKRNLDCQETEARQTGPNMARTTGWSTQSALSGTRASWWLSDPHPPWPLHKPHRLHDCGNANSYLVSGFRWNKLFHDINAKQRPDLKTPGRLSSQPVHRHDSPLPLQIWGWGDAKHDFHVGCPVGEVRVRDYGHLGPSACHQSSEHLSDPEMPHWNLRFCFTHLTSMLRG